ncbi:hypothetical protein ABZ635_22810 [Nocardiopsis sp. NPDC007018]|uniref:hypothetical protein n=1 Tax=Nocardiopsis sp. NPDC007018 TaxID=3155721 RepID=UPI0033C7B7C7
MRSGEGEVVAVMVVSLHPRPLTTEERSVVDRILRVGFPGAEQLRRQLGRILVVASWGPGSVSVDLRFTGGVPRSRVADGVVPVTCAVLDDDGGLHGEILLWAEAGGLSALEYAWYGDEPPRALPNADRMVTSRR